MRRAAKGLATLVPSVDVLATSPLVRAVQTAEIIAAVYDGVEAVETAVLTPGARPDDLVHWLLQQRPDSTLIVVGHEPSLSFHMSWLTAASRQGFFSFKKGGACMVRFFDGVEPGAGTLRWVLTAGQLRKLGASELR